MGGIEEKVMKFAAQQGVSVVGIAGPERLDGPPSLDPSYSMKGARSIVSLVMPMDNKAIYQFLGKEAYQPHLSDQGRMNQRLFRIADRIAEYIKALGHRAAPVTSNNSYRRFLDAWATHPSFSHRFPP